jgi:transposase
LSESTPAAFEESPAQKALRKKWKSIGLPFTDPATGEKITPWAWAEGDERMAGEVIWWHAGQDIGKTDLWVALYGTLARDPRQKVLGPIESFGTDGDGLARLVAHYGRFAPLRILMENTGVYSNHPYWVLREHFDPDNTLQKVVVMNSRVIAQHLLKNKTTDKVDAQRMAQLASVPEFIEPSYISTPAEFALRGVLRQRKKADQAATRVKNRVKTFLSSVGFNWKFDFDVAGQRDLVYAFVQSGLSLGEFVAAAGAGQVPLSQLAQRALPKVERQLARWSGTRLDPLMQVLIAGFFAELPRLDAQIAVYDKIVTEKLLGDGKYAPARACLEGIFGMGGWSLATVILESGPVARFNRMGQYLSYAGIANGKDESADVEVVKRPNPYSNHMLKAGFKTVAATLLLQAKAWGKSGQRPADALLAYAVGMRQRTELKSGKKVNKVAAKVARVTYAVLKSMTPYDPLYERHRAQAGTVPVKPRNRPLHRVKYLEKTLRICKTQVQSLFEVAHLADMPEAQDWLGKISNALASIDEGGLISALTLKLKAARASAKEEG